MVQFQKLHRIWLLVSIASLCGLLYGIVFAIWEMEDNSCRMTYMFQYPRFVRIHFEENEKFPRYGLYAYAEGYLTKEARSMKFTGAPVIFIPGNCGSYRQARSLASVAIRKGIDNDWKEHLDYFSVDFNEEYSALFGGFLESQKAYLQFCIKAVLKLYSNLQNAPKQVVLIGHSMGAKIAQSILTDKEYSKYINTIISIASPLDGPVINIDGYFDLFYKKIDETLSQQRTIYVNSTVNYCEDMPNVFTNKSLDNILLISIGGGTRDILIHGGITHSKYSDIHALTTSIPNVWLSTDHLCSVWCLQLVLVVNRFLYSIIAHTNSQYKTARYFIDEKEIALTKARHYFMKPLPHYRQNQVNLVSNPTKMGIWREDFRRVYTNYFEKGINITTVEMIRFIDSNQYKMLYAQISNIDSDDWIFACAAIEVYDNMRYCSKGTSLSHLIQKLPYTTQRTHFVSLDLHKTKFENPSWTHILLRLPPTREQITVNVDIFDPADRIIQIQMPKWYSFTEKTLLTDTIRGSSSYEIKVLGLHESYQSLAINLKARSCTNSSYNVVTQVCVPWIRGCEKFQAFTNENYKVLYVYVPNSRPSNYNISENVSVKLHLDPKCRYIISYKNSLGGTLSRIGQQYFQWLPAHLTAILLLGLKYQVSITPKKAAFKCGKPHIALFSSSSFFIVTATRFFGKLLTATNNFPQPDPFNPSMFISVVIHGSALALLAILVATLWLTITFCGKLVHSTLLKLIELPIPTMSETVLNLIEKLPLSAGVILFSIASASCGELALICGCCIYFMMITKQYEDYLEEFIYGTAKRIAKKLLGSLANKFLKKFKGRQLIEEETRENLDLAENQEEDLAENLEQLEEKINEQEDKLCNKISETTSEPPQEEQEETVDTKEYDSVHEGISSINFHITIFLLFLIVTLLNIPSALTWARNYRYSKSLTPDPSLMPAIVVISCTSLLWQFSAPRNVIGYSAVAYCLYTCACICVLYCQDSVYRLNSVISFVFIVITIHQLIAPKRKEEVVENDVKNDFKSKIQRILQSIIFRD